MSPFRRSSLLARLAAVTMCSTLLGVGSLEAQNAVYAEDEVKAAFLYHFGTYVEWPSGAPADDAITIAVLGAEGVARQLQGFLPGRRIQGRAVQVRRLGSIAELGDDEVLFIGPENNAQLPALIEAVASRPVLVVTDAADGLARGAMVNFQLIDERVRFEISLPNAEEAGLMLSSRLLSAALRVETARSWFDKFAPPRTRPRPKSSRRQQLA